MFRDFFRSNATCRYGAIVDVGSGSVGVAVVESNLGKAQPKIIWSYREQTTTPANFDQTKATKQISTAILNAFLELGSTGLRELRQYSNTAEIETVQVNLSAPWCYTITNTISTASDKKFKVSKKLVNELLNKADQATKKRLDQQSEISGTELVLIDQSVIDITANGYHITQPTDKLVEKLTISETRSYTDDYLVENVRSAKERVLPKAELSINTFMLVYYQALRNLNSDTSEVCLVDVTSEAVEIGIVRDGVLEHVTHMPFGTNSLAREITELCHVPKEEALGLMRENGTDLTKVLSKKKTEELGIIIESFEKKFAELFGRTGDKLSIPKTIFLHSDALTGDFFSARAKKAAHLATSCTHSVHLVTSKFFSPETGQDAALLLSAYVFHKNLTDISYLVP